jgi:hypothetical protein
VWTSGGTMLGLLAVAVLLWPDIRPEGDDLSTAPDLATNGSAMRTSDFFRKEKTILFPPTPFHLNLKGWGETEKLAVRV